MKRRFPRRKSSAFYPPPTWRKGAQGFRNLAEPFDPHCARVRKDRNPFLIYCACAREIQEFSFFL